MTGIIVAGHGSFATGITSGLKLLAGEHQWYEAVDFLPEDSVEMLTEKLGEAVERLSECEGILILTDLTGGSPFNVALRMKLSRPERLELIGGVNLPVVLDAYMSRMSAKDVSALAKGSLYAGREQMILYGPSDMDEEEYEEETV